MKHLRTEKTRTGQAAETVNCYKSWPWAQLMEGFRPFIQFAKTKSNISEPDTAETSEIIEIIEEAEPVNEGEQTLPKKNRIQDRPRNTSFKRHLILQIEARNDKWKIIHNLAAWIKLFITYSKIKLIMRRSMMRWTIYF